MIATGHWHGEILQTPQGEAGFGYDPLFWVPSLQKSAAQLSNEEKNAISHRGQALQALLQKLQEKLG
jgi:XTP/dITP diphosphohydrolase